MWQSRVEIEHYSVACFDCVIVFKVLQDRTSFKGGAHTHSVDSWTLDKSTYIVHMSPTLNESSALQHFKRDNGVKIWNGIMFDFYLGLPHKC